MPQDWQAWVGAAQGNWDDKLAAFLAQTHDDDGGLKAGSVTRDRLAADVAASLVFNVKQYGATGDGTTDDTEAIQGAIDTLTAAGGGAILFPEGTYRVSTITLKDAVVLTSTVPQSGYYAGSDVFSPVTIQGNTANSWVIDTPAAATKGIAIHGISVVGSGLGTSGGGIRFKDVSRASIKNVHVASHQDQGILISNGIGNVVEDVLAMNCLLNRTRTEAAGAVQIAGADQFLSRIEATASVTALTSANLYCNAFVIGGSNHFISNCIGEISDRGFYVTASISRFTGCRGDLNYGHDWELAAAAGVNTFAACSAVSGGRAATNTYSGFKVAGVGNVFTGCNVQQVGADRYKYAFEDTLNSGTYGQHNQYVACMPRGFTTQAVSTNGFLGSIWITGNRAILPSSGTTSIDVTGAGIVSLGSYTAATTVTAFTGGVSGQELTLIGDVDVTIANNSTIKTNTGANLTLAANRAYKFINYNNVWYQV